MPREYRHIQEYEKEILELKKQGFTHREIGEKFGLTKLQIKRLMFVDILYCKLHKNMVD